MKTPHASSEIMEINYKSPPFQHPALHEFHKIICKTIPCLITKTEVFTLFSFKIWNKMPSAPWLSIAFSDTDLMLQFCLPYPEIITLHQAVPGKQKNQYKKGCMRYVGAGRVGPSHPPWLEGYCHFINLTKTLCLFVFCRSYKSVIWQH